jgi:hypothetical protein
LGKVSYCNNVEIGHSKEAFCLIFRFQGPNGNIIEEIHMAIGPQGTKTLVELLELEMKDYEREHGTVEPWGKQPSGNPSKTQNSNSEKYVA